LTAPHRPVDSTAPGDGGPDPFEGIPPELERQNSQAGSARPRPNGGQPDPEWGGFGAFGVAPPASLAAFPEPEDRGLAALSDLGETEYVADLIRPGRIVVVAAEEGAGKSYAIDSELGIRVAVAGGSFAGTWAIVQIGPVCYLSEMHSDDDYERETTVLRSLDTDRKALTGRYYRLPLMTAALGQPCLTVPAWRDWFTGWARDHGLLLAIFDTATGATQFDPWGRAIQEVFANLRAMLEAYPALAIVLLVHMKKPDGRGERRLSDVLGEWGRWCDVVVLLERDGDTRTRVSVRKRVRHERRIVATKAGGLLVDPVDLDEAKSTKVPADAVLAAIAAAPGIDYATLGKRLDVSKPTAMRYVAALAEAGQAETRSEMRATPKGRRQVTVVYPSPDRSGIPPHSTSGTGEAVSEAVSEAVPADESRRYRNTTSPTYIGEVVCGEVVSASPDDSVQAALDIFEEDLVVRDDAQAPTVEPEEDPA
jgi:DNA-binding MarR family transcriptional regulator